MKTYYAILNVAHSADLIEIKKAYRRAVHLYHPDANGGVGDPEKFKEVVKAYQYLTKNYKALGINPVRSKKGFFASASEKVSTLFNKKPVSAPANAYTKSAAPKRGKKVRSDEFANMDPLVLQLPFEELRLRLVESGNEYVKRQSARALTCLFGGGALFALRQELATCSVPVGEEILHCLGLIGDRESINLIEKYLRHSEVKLACAAVKALQGIDQGYARTLLDKVEREGRAVRLAVFHFVETMKIRKLISDGKIGRPDLHIARFVHAHTRQPLPVIFAELGFALSE